MNIQDMTLEEIEKHLGMRRKQAVQDLIRAVSDDIDFDMDYSDWQLERGADVPKMEI